MAKWIVGKGIDEWLAKLERLDPRTSHYLGQGIYQGAKVVADELRKEIKGLPIDDGKHRGIRKGVTQIEKDGMLEGLGIATLKVERNFANVKIGMDGYNKKGKANAMIARATVSGTSFSQKNDFIGRAVRRTKSKAEDAIKLTVEKGITAIAK